MTSAQRAGALATALVVSVVSIAASPRTEYRIDGKRSRLSVETETVGLSSMFGHDHRFDARDFGGSVSVDAGSIETATLELTIQAESLYLVEDVSDDTRREIEVALREQVIETGKHPVISFHGLLA